MRTIFDGRALILIVEKPDIAFADHPKRTGTSDGASGEFWRGYTLERWAEAVFAALRDARQMPFIDASAF